MSHLGVHGVVVHGVGVHGVVVHGVVVHGVGLGMVPVVVILAVWCVRHAMAGRVGPWRGGEQLHPALGAAARLVAGDLGVHGAGVGGRGDRCGGCQQLHPALGAAARLIARDLGV